MKHQINFAIPLLVLCAFLSLPLSLSAECTLSISDAPAFKEGTGGTGTVAFGVSKTGNGSCSALFTTVTLVGSTTETASAGTSCSGNADFITQIDRPISLLASQNTATITVTTCADNRDEPNESFGILLHHAQTGTTIGTAALARVTLLDDDPPPDLRINDISINEGNSNHSAVFNVSLLPASGFQVSLNWNSEAITATQGTACGGAVDFARVSSILILPREQTTGHISVPVCGDASVEPNETFRVELFLTSDSDPSRVNIVDTEGIATLINDDLPTVTAQSTQHNEGNAGNNPIPITVRLSAPNPNGASVLCLPQEIGTSLGITPAQGASSCASGVDFVTQGNRAVFGPTETSKTCTVTLCGDTVREPDESFIVTLQNLHGAIPTIGTPTVLIKNDD